MTSAVDFGSLVGAQLSALIEAEVEGAEKTSEFIERVGFEKQDDGSLSLRTVAFDMARRDVDGTIRLHTIKVPVLTLVPIPLLTIEEADLQFELQVEDIPPAKSDSASSTQTKVGASLLTRARNRLVTRLARTSHQDTTAKSDLKMSVKIRQSAFPLGIERLLNTADLSVADELKETR